MVGDLRDKLWQGDDRTEPPSVRLLVEAPKQGRIEAPKQLRVEVRLTNGQLDELLEHWTDVGRNSPTELVVKVGDQEVGVLQVVSARFVPSVTADARPT